MYFARISEELCKDEEVLIVKKKLRIMDVINILKKDKKYCLVFKNYQTLSSQLTVNMQQK